LARDALGEDISGLIFRVSPPPGGAERLAFALPRPIISPAMRQSVLVTCASPSDGSSADVQVCRSLPTPSNSEQGRYAFCEFLPCDVTRHINHANHADN